MSEPKPSCSVPDCGKSSVARGWCPKHWLRWRKYGDPAFVIKASGEEMARRARRHGEAARRGKHTAEYDAWRSMKHRCYYKKGHGYADYGGRGITVCDRWRDSYEAFLADVGRRPSPSHSLNRIDNNGNYEPGNVEWATPTEQMRNTSRNRRLTIDGQTKCVAEWATISGLEVNTIRFRLRRGMAAKEAVFTPSRNGLLTINGITKPLSEWAKESPVGDRSIRERLDRGWNPYDAVFHPRVCTNRPFQPGRDSQD